MPTYLFEAGVPPLVASIEVPASSEEDAFALVRHALNTAHEIPLVSSLPAGIEARTYAHEGIQTTVVLVDVQP